MTTMGRTRLVQRMSRAVAIAMLAATTMAAPALAADPKPPVSNPVGTPGWKPDVAPTPQVTGITLDPAQLETIKKVTAYFNALGNMRGAFLQTSADRKRLRGKFFVKRPGRLRFEYSPPSKQLIVSDGKSMSVQDLDLGTDDRYPLDQTPFRILLRQDVDLIRDSRILEVQESEDLIVVALQDKSPDAPGKIRLFLSKAPTLELKEWVTTDAQGETRVELSNLVTSEELDVKLFVIVSPTLKKFQ